jgi:hypothetical protein
MPAAVEPTGTDSQSSGFPPGSYPLTSVSFVAAGQTLGRWLLVPEKSSRNRSDQVLNHPLMGLGA